MHTYSELERLPGVGPLLERAEKLKAVDFDRRPQLLDDLIREADDVIVSDLEGSGVGVVVLEDLQKSFRFWSHFVSDVFVPTAKLEEWMK